MTTHADEIRMGHTMVWLLLLLWFSGVFTGLAVAYGPAFGQWLRDVVYPKLHAESMPKPFVGLTLRPYQCLEPCSVDVAVVIGSYEAEREVCLALYEGDVGVYGEPLQRSCWGHTGRRVTDKTIKGIWAGSYSIVAMLVETSSHVSARRKAGGIGEGCSVKLLVQVLMWLVAMLGIVGVAMSILPIICSAKAAIKKLFIIQGVK